MTIIARDYKMSPVKCPACGADLSGTTAFGSGQPPLPGDITTCVECIALLKFDDDMLLVRLSPREQDQARRENPMIRTFEQLLRELHRRRAAHQQTGGTTE